MPLYDYKCKCGETFRRFLHLREYREPQHCDICGEVAEKVLSAPMVRPDYAGYECPVTGKFIEGRRAHAENLKRTGCRLFEPGETQEMLRRKAAEDDAFCERIADSAAAMAESLPTKKKEQLGRELESGAAVGFERKTL